MERYRRTVRTNVKNEDKVDFKVKFVRQSIVCGVVFAIVFVISLLKTDTATIIHKHIDRTLSYTVDYKSTIMEIADKIAGIIK